jgi:hypothetical protein
MASVPNEDAPDAILHTDTGKRLDAVIRRLGGKPSRSAPVDGSPRFPALGTFKIKQDDLFTEDSE